MFILNNFCIINVNVKKNIKRIFFFKILFYNKLFIKQYLPVSQKLLVLLYILPAQWIFLIAALVLR